MVSLGFVIGGIVLLVLGYHEMHSINSTFNHILTGSPNDKSIMVFCIMSRGQIVRGYYSISNQPGYQERMTVGVVHWPSRKGLGSVEIWGDPPRQTRPVTYSPEYASAVRIKDWIEKLPRDGATPVRNSLLKPTGGGLY